MKLEEFKNFFLAKKQEIISLSEKKASEDPVEISGDEIDIAQGLVIDDINSKLSERFKTKLLKINVALKKINDGTFGICDLCEEDISEQRLLAIPDCKFCISCAEQNEKIRKQYR